MLRSSGLRGAELKGSAPVFAALGDETRLQIVARLCRGGPQSIVRLADGSGVTRQAITKHLHVLSDAGLVRGIRAGRERVWELEPERLEAARRCIENISAQWDLALGRLKAFVENG
jgi:DNA-binding transcriptional ArsR family regulator